MLDNLTWQIVHDGTITKTNIKFSEVENLAKYLEYDINSGRIISEIISSSPPKVLDGFSLLEVDSEQEIDTSAYAIRDGKLVKLYETAEERIERERLRKVKKEQTRERIKSMGWECIMAILDDNDDAVKSLQKEFKGLKAYI